MKPSCEYFCECLNEYRKFDTMVNKVMDVLGACELNAPAHFKSQYIEMLIRSTIGIDDYEYFDTIMDSVWDYLTWGELAYHDSNGDHVVGDDKDLYYMLINND